MTIHAYLERPEISRSQLMDILRSPRHYWYNHISGLAEPETSAAMDEGTILHTLVLEPHRLNDVALVMPEHLKKPTKAQVNAANPSDSTRLQIEDWNAWHDDARGRAIVKQDRLQEINAWAEALRSDSVIAPLLNGRSEIEKTLTFVDDATGLGFKVRIDILTQAACIDVKTCADASPSGFARSVVNYGYDIQAYMYVRACRENGLGERDFFFACVEKSAPHCTALYKAGEEILASGEHRFRLAAHKLAACMAADRWPSYTEECTELDLPGWHMNTIFEQEAEIV